MGWLSMLLAGGVVQDIWAHNHGLVDQSFFTPWHAILYSTMTIVGVFLAANAFINHRKGCPWGKSLPAGYGLSLVGAFLFALGGALDLWWHTIFGIEADTEALLSPTHLLLLTSALLIVTGPMRAAWLTFDPRTARGWRTLGPALLGATAALTLLGQFTQFASPMVSPLAAKDPTKLPAYTDIFVMNADGSGQTRITMQPDQVHFGPAWSPDGLRVAFMIRAGNSQHGELYVADADGSHLRQVTHNGLKNYYPAWSPDGALIAFNAQRGINTQTAAIHVIRADGSGERTLTSALKESYHPSWAPDGARIAFASKDSGTWHLYVMDAGGRNVHELTTPAQAGDPAWSPNGASIAFTQNPDDESAVVVMAAAGSRAKTIGPPGSSAPAWSPDGSMIAFDAPAGSGSDIYVVSASGGKVRDLTNDRAIYSTSPQWSPDGKHIAYSGLGHNGRISDDANHAIGVADVIVQTVLLMGMTLLLARAWTLPIGALTVVIAVPSIAQLIMADNYMLAPSAILTGVLADFLAARWGTPLPSGVRLYTFGAIIPAAYQICILLSLFLTTGVAWSVNMVAGSVLFAAATGLFLTFLLDWPGVRPQGSLVQ